MLLSVAIWPATADAVINRFAVVAVCVVDAMAVASMAVDVNVLLAGMSCADIRIISTSELTSTESKI